MKISKCPVCGRTPTVMTLEYSDRSKVTSISCGGTTGAMHAPVRSGAHSPKKDAIAAWEAIVRDVHAKSDRKCVNGNCSIRATCGRYHQAANVFEARGADGLYDSHSCRKGKCDHYLAKGVQP